MVPRCLFVAALTALSLLINTSIVTGVLVPLNEHVATKTTQHEIKNIAIVGQLSKSKLFFTNSSEEATMNWLDALEFCHVNKMQPAQIAAESENGIVANYLNTTFISNKDFWLGATDFGRENSYHWITGEEMVYTHWRPDEPEESLNLNCLLIDQAGTWRTMSCTATFRPLCQTLS